MTAAQLADALRLERLALPAPEKEIKGAYAGDLLSWVMGRATEGCVWATIMTNVNVLAVATLVDMGATVVCEGCEVPEEIIRAANERGVNLLRTNLPLFEFCAALSDILS